MKGKEEECDTHESWITSLLVAFFGWDEQLRTPRSPQDSFSGTLLLAVAKLGLFPKHIRRISGESTVDSRYAHSHVHQLQSNLARSQNTYAGYLVSRLLTLGTPIQSRTPGIGLVAVKLGSFPKRLLRKSGELAVASKYAHSVTYTRYRVKVMKDNDKLEEMRYYVEETLIPAYMKPRCYCIPILLMSQFFLMFGTRFKGRIILGATFVVDWITDDAKAQYLAEILRGPALAVLQNISEPTRLDYDALTSALVLRFGDKHLRHLYHAQLKNRVQRPNESLAELAADVERLSQLALEGCPADTRDVITVGAFLDAISDREVQQTVRVAGLRTMREALARALEVESPKLLQGPRGV
uniref:Uncharacterized protein n=1 Tax=Timema douglasi TaxID=61478 RepID=A0A7R8VMU7_TIMDO|nr:unnamed protein product [Timema douglasi]